MFIDKLKQIRVILGSQSPRRKELLAKMNVSFQVVVRETDEHYDPTKTPEEIVRSIALNKLNGFGTEEFKDALIITADTIVVHQQQILGKPVDEAEAFRVLNALQGEKHIVLTAVSIKFAGKISQFVEHTAVEFYPLTNEEITYYITQYAPMDKAGAYGIQEWIGLVGIKAIEGSYENVVGLPTARLYQELKKLLT